MTLRYAMFDYIEGSGELAMMDGDAGSGSRLVLRYDDDNRCWNRMVREPPAWEGDAWVVPLDQLPASVRKIFKGAGPVDTVKLRPFIKGNKAVLVVPPAPTSTTATCAGCSPGTSSPAARGCANEGFIAVARTAPPRPDSRMWDRNPELKKYPAHIRLGLIYFDRRPGRMVADMSRLMRPRARDLANSRWKPVPYRMA